MFRIAAKLSLRTSSSAVLISLTAKPSPISFTRPSPLASSSFFRECTSTTALDVGKYNTALELGKENTIPKVVRFSKYALGQARNRKSVGSYGLGYFVLKHCLTELVEGNDPQHENAKGIALLAMATLLSERRNPGDYEDAIERLQAIQELTQCYMGVKVAAFEALAGLYLESGEDEMASEEADKCIELMEKNKTEEDFDDLNLRARAVKGLVELVIGNVESAEAFFDHQPPQEYFATAALSYGEFQQIKKNYPMAKETYQRVIEATTNLKDELKESGNSYLGAGNMSLEGVLMGATCALGQLESQLGNYNIAEEHLTNAVTMAEKAYGEKHPKLAVVLTSIALMYRRKAIDEKLSSLLVQEGLCRRVIEILKVPDTETESEGTSPSVDRSDIAALARGLYAEVLGVQANRKEEGEKMKNLAESLWKNRRMSLADALGNTEANLSYVIDPRISRIL